MPELKLIPYFLNHEIALSVLGGLAAGDRDNYLLADTDGHFERQAKHHQLCHVLATNLDPIGVTDLERAVLKDDLHPGDLVAIEQAFYFRRDPDPDGSGRIFFHGVLHTDDSINLEGSADLARMVSGTGATFLTGRRTVYLLAVVAGPEGSTVSLRPFFIGNLGIAGTETEVIFQSFNHRRVHPSQIDQFANADFSKVPASRFIEAVESMAETDVKHYLAQVLGESFEPKDWGGEKSDLYTSSMTVEGRPISAAWLLKGKSVKRPMKIADLGRNGDQIDRLFTEPADLLVVQHNRHITSAVVNMMEVYAHDVRRPRKFMILDGAQTAAVLAAYGHIS